MYCINVHKQVAVIIPKRDKNVTAASAVMASIAGSGADFMSL
jgi:hypothetical protein